MVTKNNSPNTKLRINKEFCEGNNKYTQWSSSEREIGEQKVLKQCENFLKGVQKICFQKIEVIIECG